MGRGKRKTRPEVNRMLAHVIRDHRHARGWRQLDPALALGVSVRQVKRWEAGKHVPSPRTRDRVLRVPGFSAGAYGRTGRTGQHPLETAVNDALQRLGVRVLQQQPRFAPALREF